jgi:hypothetical protein
MTISPTAGSGSGGSGALGVPLSPTQRDIEATAWTEVNKAALGIVHDSIELSFSQIDQRYSKSHLGTQTGYRAREEQPVLDHSIDTARVLQSSTLPMQASWNAAYEQLVSQLPPDVLARFTSEQQKPPNERDPSFTAVANVLMLGAQILTMIGIHSQPPSPDSLEAAHTQNNQDASIMAMKQSIINTVQVADQAEEFLDEQGANLPYFDEYRDAITQIRDIVQNFK